MAPPKGSSRNPSWFKAGGGTNGESVNIPSLADNLSYSMIPKPFKDTKKKKGTSSSSSTTTTTTTTTMTTRRNKPLKQIIALERLRAKQASDKLNNKPNNEDDIDMNNSYDQQQQASSTTTKKSKKEILGPITPGVNYNAYMVIEAPPSVIPPKKYCDITGLEAPYVDPKTRLRYHNIEVYELIKTFGPGLDQSYLSLRGAHVTLR